MPSAGGSSATSTTAPSSGCSASFTTLLSPMTWPPRPADPRAALLADIVATADERSMPCGRLPEGSIRRSRGSGPAAALEAFADDAPIPITVEPDARQSLRSAVEAAIGGL